MRFFDMHSHILPDFDDGAKNIEDALQLIDSLKNQNITNICLTPHFYTDEISVEEFVEKRNEAFEKFKSHIPKDIKVVLGAEVYVTKYLFGNDDLSKITYGNSKYILTEYGYSDKFGNSTMEYFYRLHDNFGLIPVIPHIERYSALIDNPSRIAELREMGVVIQTNISSYIKKSHMLKRKKLIKLINEGMIDIIGSDAHSFEYNSPKFYSQAIEYITSKCGEHTVAKMMSNAEHIFEASL